MSDFLNKAKDALGDMTDKVKDSGLLDETEDIAGSKADSGAIGAVADKANDVIDQIQGTED